MDELTTLPYAEVEPLVAGTLRRMLPNVRNPQTARAQVSEGDVSCAGDFAFDGSLLWVRGDLTIGGNFSVMDTCAVFVEGDLACNHAILFGANVLVRGAVRARGTVAASFLSTEALHATALVYGANNGMWLEKLPTNHGVPMLELRMMPRAYTVPAEILDARGYLDRSRLTSFLSRGGTVVPEPAEVPVPDGHITAPEADAVLGATYFAGGKTTFVRRIDGIQKLKSFDARKRANAAGDTELVLFDGSVTVSGRMVIDCSEIGIAGDLHVDALEAGDGRLAVRGTIRAVSYIFVPEIEGELQFGGHSLEHHGPAALDAPLVVFCGRDGSGWQAWVRESGTLVAKPELLEQQHVRDKNGISEAKLRRALRSNKFLPGA